MIRTQYYILFLLLFLIGCDNNPKTTVNEANEEQEGLVTVEVVSPEKRSFTSEVFISATALPNKSAKLHAIESGYLSKLYKDIGDEVEKNEKLAQLINPAIDQQLSEVEADYLSSQAQLDGLKSELEAARASEKIDTEMYLKLKSVYEKTPQLIPLIELDKAKGKSIMSMARLSVLESKIRAQKSEIEGLKTKLEYTKKRKSLLTIRAPFEGIITMRYVDEGTTIQSGITNSNAQAIYEIQDLDPIRLTMDIPESDAMTIAKGSEIEVEFPELEGSSFKAKVSRKSGALDRGSKTMQVEADLVNTNNQIISGMFAQTQIQSQSREGVLSLPLQALKQYKDLPHIILVDDNMVKYISVRKGLSNKDYFEVLNSNIDEQSKVIIQGKGMVKEGQRVNAILKN